MLFQKFKSNLSFLVTNQNETLLSNHTSIVWSLTFGLDANQSPYLTTGSGDGKINIWSRLSDTWPLTSQMNNEAVVYSLVPLPNQLLASVSSKNVQVWNLVTRTVVKTFSGHSGVLNQIAVSPDQQMIASASNDMTSKVWRVSSGLCLITMIGHTDQVRSVAFYSNDTVVTGSLDNSIKVWAR